MAAYLTPTEAAAFLRLTPRRLMHLRTSGGGPRYIRVGLRRLLYAEADLLAWLDSRSFSHRAQETCSAASRQTV